MKSKSSIGKKAKANGWIFAISLMLAVSVWIGAASTAWAVTYTWRTGLSGDFFSPSWCTIWMGDCSTDYMDGYYDQYCQKTFENSDSNDADVECGGTLKHTSGDILLQFARFKSGKFQFRGGNFTAKMINLGDSIDPSLVFNMEMDDGKIMANFFQIYERGDLVWTGGEIAGTNWDQLNIEGGSVAHYGGRLTNGLCNIRKGGKYIIDGEARILPYALYLNKGELDIRANTPTVHVNTLHFDNEGFGDADVNVFNAEEGTKITLRRLILDPQLTGTGLNNAKFIFEGWGTDTSESSSITGNASTDKGCGDGAFDPFIDNYTINSVDIGLIGQHAEVTVYGTVYIGFLNIGPNSKLYVDSSAILRYYNLYIAEGGEMIIKPGGVTCKKAELTLAAAADNPVNKEIYGATTSYDTRSLTVADVSEPALKCEFQLNDVDNWNLFGLTFTTWGTGNETEDIRQARLVRVMPDNSEMPLGVAVPSNDDGTITFTGNPFLTFLTKNHTNLFYLYYDFKSDKACPCRTYEAHLSLNGINATPSNTANEYLLLPENGVIGGSLKIKPGDAVIADGNWQYGQASQKLSRPFIVRLENENPVCVDKVRYYMAPVDADSGARFANNDIESIKTIGESGMVEEYLILGRKTGLPDYYRTNVHITHKAENCVTVPDPLFNAWAATMADIIILQKVMTGMNPGVDLAPYLQAGLPLNDGRIDSKTVQFLLEAYTGLRP